jgi:hypothetical protein
LSACRQASCVMLAIFNTPSVCSWCSNQNSLFSFYQFLGLTHSHTLFGSLIE